MKKWMAFVISALALPSLTTPALQAKHSTPAVLKAAEQTKAKKISGLNTHTHIKLIGCDAEIIRSANKAKQFLHELCKLATFKCYGDAHIAHYGNGENAGYFCMQALDKGHVIAYLLNNSNSVQLTISNSGSYNPYDIVSFSKDFFKAKKFAVKTVQV